jgi:protein involved in sex pheromone biosynthesis
VAVLQPEDWIKPDNLTLLTAWARDGLIDKEIAEKMNVSPPTLYKYKKMFPEIVEALRKGKELVDVEVENALYKKALGYNVSVQKAFKVKDIVYNENGKKISETERIEYAEEEIHIPADTTAQIFWLKNRKRKNWRDKVEYETNNDELNKVKELLSKISDEAKNG